MKGINPEDVDIRLAVGQPRGGQAIKITCPMHKERLGVEDDIGSLAVYPANLHCFGCGWHVARRYAALAFLTGEWDGRGDENSARVKGAVMRVKERLQEFVGEGRNVQEALAAPPLNPLDALAFHQFLLSQSDVLERLMWDRGLSFETIRQFRLGYTGTHFTIPVYDLDGTLVTVRYRADDRMVDPNEPGYRKYEGTWGRNSPFLYPLPVLPGIPPLQDEPPLELWVVEGEFDALVSIQAGSTTLTITNGATNLHKLPEMLASLLPDLLVGSWVIATDQDEAGEKAAKRLAQVLSGQSVVRARWGRGKDLTEYYAAGGRKEEIWYV